MTRARCAILALPMLMVAALGFGQKNLMSGLEKAPAGARSQPNPYEGRPEAIQAGQKLFRRHCAECHGANASGSNKAPALRSTTIRNAPPGALVWFLKNGNLRAGMPSWSGLPEQRRWQIVAYLKSLQ
jgi:mono/diheme cytochrome c family protein